MMGLVERRERRDGAVGEKRDAFVSGRMNQL